MNLNDWTGYQIDEDVLDQASQWLVKLDRSDEEFAQNCLSAADFQHMQQSFNQWLSRNPKHQAAFYQMSEVWAKSAVMSEFEKFIDRTEVVQFPHKSFSQPVLVSNDIAPQVFSNTYEELSAPTWVYNTALAIITLGVFFAF
ncbi:FecR/PupR family sigma factor regulator [Glaciecola sp. 1036]|uniref:FecR/PupR family sigma factor regulator n=1 Tax=Alteromonadaceae TaxID=72275 RepID=UPI003CFE20AD